MNNKAMRKLIPAIAMLVIAAVALTSASYAWFTMSRTVEATGMKMQAVAPTNLLISTNETTGFAESAATTVDFGESKLIPASSMDGTAFYAANNIKAATAGAPDDTTTWETVTGTPIAASTGEGESLETHNGYYADFTFYLATTGEEDVPVTISQLAELTSIAKTNLTDADITQAVRFAILDENGAAFTGDGTGDKNVYAFDADYFASVTGPVTNPAAVDGWQGEADANITDGTVIFTVPGGCTVSGGAITEGTSKQITIRVWIEGQDADCVSAAAASSFEMQVGFSDVNYAEGIN